MRDVVLSVYMYAKHSDGVSEPRSHGKLFSHYIYLHIYMDGIVFSTYLGG